MKILQNYNNYFANTRNFIRVSQKFLCRFVSLLLFLGLVRFVAFARDIFLIGTAFRTVGDGSWWAANLDQTIGQQRFAVFPDPGLVGVQHDGNDFVSFSEGGTHQDLLGGARIASLKSVTSGKVPQQAIMISQLVDNTFRRLPGVINR